MSISKPAASSLVTIVIINYETSAYVKRCIESLRQQTHPWEAIVVDNPSAEMDYRNLNFSPPVRVVRSPENVGYGLGCNLGASMASPQSEFICILNPDTVVPPGELERWVAAYRASCPRGGILGPALLNDNGAAQRSSYDFPNPFNYWMTHSLLAGFLINRKKGSWTGGKGRGFKDPVTQTFRSATNDMIAAQSRESDVTPERRLVESGETNIGKRQLPKHLFAHLYQSQAAEAIAALAHLAKQQPGLLKGIVYALASADGYNKFKELGLPVENDYFHAITADGITHALKAHGDPQKELARGQMAISVTDFQMLPEITKPENLLAAARLTGGEMAFYYQKRVNGHVLLVQYAGRRHGQMLFHTMQKKKAEWSSPAALQNQKILQRLYVRNDGATHPPTLINNPDNKTLFDPTSQPAANTFSSNTSPECANIATPAHPHTANSVGWLMGAALLMDRPTWQRLIGFSEHYFLYSEDTDLCWRCDKLGLPVIYDTAIQIYHSQGDPAAGAARENGIVRLFDGMKRFVDQNYTGAKRAGMYLAVCLDMLIRLGIMLPMRAARPHDPLLISRTRGYTRVLRQWLGV